MSTNNKDDDDDGRQDKKKKVRKKEICLVNIFCQEPITVSVQFGFTVYKIEYFSKQASTFLLKLPSFRLLPMGMQRERVLIEKA